MWRSCRRQPTTCTRKPRCAHRMESRRSRSTSESSWIRTSCVVELLAAELIDLDEDGAVDLLARSLDKLENLYIDGEHGDLVAYGFRATPWTWHESYRVMAGKLVLVERCRCDKKSGTTILEQLTAKGMLPTTAAPRIANKSCMPNEPFNERAQPSLHQSAPTATISRVRRTCVGELCSPEHTARSITPRSEPLPRHLPSLLPAASALAGGPWGGRSPTHEGERSEPYGCDARRSASSNGGTCSMREAMR